MRQASNEAQYQACFDFFILTMTQAPASPTYCTLPTDKELVMKVIPMPADCNGSGDIFGGWVMAQVDIAGSILPVRYTDANIVTVAVNEFVFKHPVRVGDILSLYASVVRIGRTSITVQVDVYSEHFLKQQNYLLVAHAALTYVAVDAQGRPQVIQKTLEDLKK